MGTVETRSRTLVPPSTHTPEPGKPLTPIEKTPKEAIESLNEEHAGSESAVEGFAGVNQENGVSKEESIDDLGRGVVENETGISGAEEGVLVECKHGLGSGSVEKLEDGAKERNGEKGYLEDNGVSLDVNEGENGKVRSIEVAAEDLSEVEDLVSSEGHEFSVGDFVWGKVKSHPWWPGQIYDPSYASDYAAKKKGKDKYLVAYFGDGTFAWCPPSQLKPFEENFDEMSKQSNTKTFVSAVRQVTDVIGRLLELKLICSCVPKENRSGLAQPLAENAGIRQGVLVPECETRKLSGVYTEPSELLAELKRVAQAVYVTNVLELRVLRSRVSALYRTKGCFGLPEYHDPKPVPGLDDSGKSVEVPSQGPFEDWLPSPMSVDVIQASEPVLQSSPAVSENRKIHRRKQRSIADLIGGNKEAETGASASGLKKGKGRGESKDGEVATEGTKSKKPAPRSGVMKREGREESDSHDDSSLISLTGKRRKARLSGYPVTTSISSISSVKKDGDGEKEKTKEGIASKGRTRKKRADIGNGEAKSKTRSGGDSVSRNLKLDIDSVKSDDSVVKEHFEMGSSPRERKKSKYLSPPFTMLDNSKKKRETETETLKIPTEEGIEEEESTMEADQDIVSPPTLKRSSEALQNNVSTEPGPGDEKSRGSSPNPMTPIQSQTKISDETIANVSAKELLSEIRSAAVNLFTPMGKKPLEMVVDFVSLFRNSVYRNGSNYKLYNKLQSSRKRKTRDSEFGPQKEVPKRTAEKSTERVSGRRKVKNQNAGAGKPKEKGAVKTHDAKSDRRKPKKGARTPETKTVDKENVEGKASPAALFVTFGPGSLLPTKGDLIRMYGKYGELDETETEMFYNNFCARVSFTNSSNAEVAFNDSQNASPFGSASVSFRLQYHSGAFKTRELNEISKRQRTATPFKNNVKTPKKPKSQPKGGSESDLNFIKQKLEKISSLLEDRSAKVTPRTKSKLQGELKGLLEKVGTMVGGSSS
ncbi:PWWP domain containing protein [Parasponia andersonii]|uniref:PWWP domain containing protein n=1 Tax=Parasponia andersonii TaxID=3476 RepID=A0A2P5AYH2_PARAD|nr:PWWP domain containing protein [Parasponia andersonii]